MLIVGYRRNRRCSGATFPVRLLNCQGGSARIVPYAPATLGSVFMGFSGCDEKNPPLDTIAGSTTSMAFVELALALEPLDSEARRRRQTCVGLPWRRWIATGGIVGAVRQAAKARHRTGELQHMTLPVSVQLTPLPFWLGNVSRGNEVDLCRPG